MRLYFREKQLTLLDKYNESAQHEANFVLLFGKRKVGKTTLVAEHLRRRRGVYLSIGNKASQLQLNDISEYLKSIQASDKYIPSFRSWKDFFEYIFFISKEHPVSLALDEFHNFEKIEPSLFGELRDLWEKHSANSKVNIIAITSDMDFIQRTFLNTESPLYRFQNNTLKLSPFVFSEVARIIQMHDSILPLEEALKIYLVFGGLPKYYALIDRFDLWNKNVYEILRELVFHEYAPLGYELKELLVNEFSRGNKVYLSILQAIASGKENVTEIARAVAIPPTSVAKYVFELERKKYLLKRRVPIGTSDPSKSKFGKYFLSSFFDNFWFRFIQPDLITYEMGNYDKMLFNVAQKLPQYFQNRSRLVVKELFREFTGHKLISSIVPDTRSEIGEGWNRDASVDLAVVQDETNVLFLGDVIGNENGSLRLQIHEFAKKTALLKEFYERFSMERFIVSWDILDSDALRFLSESDIKYLYLKDLLNLADYRTKPSRLIRSKTQRLRKTYPAQIPLFEDKEHAEKR